MVQEGQASISGHLTLCPGAIFGSSLGSSLALDMVALAALRTLFLCLLDSSPHPPFCLLPGLRSAPPPQSFLRTIQLAVFRNIPIMESQSFSPAPTPVLSCCFSIPMASAGPKLLVTFCSVFVGKGSHANCLTTVGTGSFPGGSVVRNLPQYRGCRTCGSIAGLGRSPWRKAWQPTPVFLPGKSCGQRSLVGFSLWGCKESDVTEATEHTHM